MQLLGRSTRLQCPSEKLGIAFYSVREFISLCKIISVVFISNTMSLACSALVFSTGSGLITLNKPAFVTFQKREKTMSSRKA